MTKSYTNEELALMSKDELKAIVEAYNVTIKGLWAMNKSNIIAEILKLQGDVTEAPQEAIEIELLQPEIVEPEAIQIEEVAETPKKARKLNNIFKAFSPEGELMFTTQKLGDMFAYAHDNKLCNRGWVLISMNDNVPVTMRIKKTETLEEYKQNPKVTSKYTGNFWRFTREEA